MTHFGVPELLIILMIIILLFGVGRIGKVTGELGKGIKSFKVGLQGENKDESVEASKTIEPKYSHQFSNYETAACEQEVGESSYSRLPDFTFN